MTVVLVDPQRPTLVPVEAVALLGGDVQYTEEMPVRVPWSLPAARPCYSGVPDDAAPVLLSSDPGHPAVRARLAAGERLIQAGQPVAGGKLVDAVAMMDQLRTRGPWESAQTHETLRRYLLEETYELFDALRSGDAAQVRDELGDVLLQVLFHARVAEDAAEDGFGIDDVAEALMRKLTHRVPAVLAGEDVTLADQLAQWERRKAAERTRLSCLDGVPTGQPALALAQKVIGRVTEAGLPAALIPAALTAVTVSADGDAESALRAAVLDFADDVRAAERRVAAQRRGADPAALEQAPLEQAPLGIVTAAEWRRHWPGGPRLAEVTDLPEEVPEVVDELDDLPPERHDAEPDDMDLPVGPPPPPVS